VESRNQQIRDELHEMSKPLARYADDEDLERYLKEQEREGDPMLAYICGKKWKGKAKAGLVEKPQFEGGGPVHAQQVWDQAGAPVGRGGSLEQVREKVVRVAECQEDTYKWSTEDMDRVIINVSNIVDGCAVCAML
jgi:pre-mRNA-splicing factor CWC26